MLTSGINNGFSFGGPQLRQDPANMSSMMMMVMMQMMQMMASLVMGQMGQQMGQQPGGGCRCGQGGYSPEVNPGFGGNAGAGGPQNYGGGPQGYGGGVPGYDSFGGSSGNGAGGGAQDPASSQEGSSSGGSPTTAGRRTGQIVDVPGGRVDASIAPNVRAMMAAARRDGINLQINSSYRSRAQQERLYAAYRNGTGNLAARPGTSNHESGLAIDFRNTPGAHRWLRNNAERFGLRNLPGEPWHYSTTGR